MVQSTSILPRNNQDIIVSVDCVVKDSVNHLDHVNGKKRESLFDPDLAFYYVLEIAADNEGNEGEGLDPEMAKIFVVTTFFFQLRLYKMIVRIRSKEGTSRFEVDPNDDVMALAEKIAIQLKFDPSTLKISKDPQNGVQAKYLSGQSIAQLGINHGDLIYITFEDGAKPGTSIVSAGKQPASTVGPFEPTTNTSSSSALNVKQEAVDDYLEKQSGFIKRGRDPKFCKHSIHGMCDYCMPLECKEYVGEPDYRLKQRCLNGHAPWPEGICTNCQPSAVTLQQLIILNFRHRISLMTSLIFSALLDINGLDIYMDGNQTDGLSLNLPWNEEESVDEGAAACGLFKVGMIFTDLMDAGQGKVICKQHIDSYFLSSQVCCFSAAMQTKNPNVTKLSASGKILE
ncbi:345_t:CDS:10 [Ambispora gerdemannii]|uniref:Nuclear protein localization protein 4 n=1 Tax=Ambispora gerdemannii TaxID=144530 RepID=A0A9N9AIN7_9GLOM|nr:345_t:CDS:10 [Ambispora gerdemannii]